MRVSRILRRTSKDSEGTVTFKAHRPNYHHLQETSHKNVNCTFVMRLFDACSDIKLITVLLNS